jgi:hypothetical protein
MIGEVRIDRRGTSGPERSDRYARAALRNHLGGKPPIGGIGKDAGFPQNFSLCLTAPVSTDGVRDARRQ